MADITLVGRVLVPIWRLLRDVAKAITPVVRTFARLLHIAEKLLSDGFVLEPRLETSIPHTTAEQYPNKP